MHSNLDLLIKKFNLILGTSEDIETFEQKRTFEEKLQYIKDHFLIKEMEIKLLERRFLLSEERRQELIETLDAIISKNRNN